ncbi:MAG: hypothetical protein JW703_04590 [Candidatus Diapherotrites archaeon]|nr:hypothetical protein [Candidatus Diapherotrites archaeon]
MARLIQKKGICREGYKRLTNLFNEWNAGNIKKHNYLLDGKQKEIIYSPEDILITDKNGKSKKVQAIIISDEYFAKENIQRHAIDLDGNIYIRFQGKWRFLGHKDRKAFTKF